MSLHFVCFYGRHYCWWILFIFLNALWLRQRLRLSLSLISDVDWRHFLIWVLRLGVALNYLSHLVLVYRVILRQLNSYVYLLVELFVSLGLLLVWRTYLSCGCQVYLLLVISWLRWIFWSLTLISYLNVICFGFSILLNLLHVLVFLFSLLIICIVLSNFILFFVIFSNCFLLSF